MLHLYTEQVIDSSQRAHVGTSRTPSEYDQPLCIFEKNRTLSRYLSKEVGNRSGLICGPLLVVELKDAQQRHLERRQSWLGPWLIPMIVDYPLVLSLINNLYQ